MSERSSMLYGKLKEYRALLTFPSLADVMHAEGILTRLDCPSAVVRTPSSLRSSCNSMSLCLPLESKAIIDELINEGVVFTGMYEAREDGFFTLGW